MKKWHIIIINLILLTAIFTAHILMLNLLVGYIPVYSADFRKIVIYHYPYITIEWHAEPHDGMPGGGGGIGTWDITLPLLITAIILNIILLAKKEKQ